MRRPESSHSAARARLRCASIAPTARSISGTTTSSRRLTRTLSDHGIQCFSLAGGGSSFATRTARRLGWRTNSGEMVSFRNVIVRFPDDRLTVIVLTNRDDPEPYKTALAIADL